MRYGGNTCCVELRCGEHTLVLDAGTGVRALGVALERAGAANISLLISHTHMDHIQGFPFFAPAYNLRKTLTVYEPPGLSVPIEEALKKQTEPYYFPVPLEDLPAHMDFRSTGDQLRIGEAAISRLDLNHPGGCSGYRIEYEGKVLVYLTDHEPYRRLFGDTDYSRAKDAEVRDFMRGADLVLRDAQYTVDEYDTRRGWGHGTFHDAAEDTKLADVRRMMVFHHDPDHSDDFLDACVASMQKRFKLDSSRLFLAREGEETEV
jgi:phosphoribosyl 1,2-cyclic phosphodiesterase